MSGPSDRGHEEGADHAEGADEAVAQAARTFWIGSIAIVLLSTLLQIGALRYGTVIDDNELLYFPSSRGCGNHPADCFVHPVFGLYYRPMMTATFALGERLRGPYPLPLHREVFLSHFENLLLHAAVVALALWLFHLLLRRNAPALLAGLLFGLHPLHVCVTTFIGGRTDTLAHFFLMWFAIGLVRSGANTSKHGRSNTPIDSATDTPLRRIEGNGYSAGLATTWARTQRWRWRIVSLVGFAGAVFTKEQTIPLVLLVPLLANAHVADAHVANEEMANGDARKDARPAPCRRLWWLLYGVPIVIYLAAARRIMPPNAYDRAAWSTALHLEMIGRTLWYYAKLLCFPTVSAIHQSTLGPWDTPQPLVLFLGYAVGGAWLTLLGRLWPERTARLLMLWTTLLLLPCLNLFPIPSQFIASYRALLPLFGLAGLAGRALAPLRPNALQAELPRPKTLAASRLDRAQFLRMALMGILCAAFAGVTRADVAIWHDDLTLGAAEFRADPNFLPALAGLAGNLQRAAGAPGNPRRTQQLQEALTKYDQVLARLFPDAETTEARIAQRDSPALMRRLKSMSGLRYRPGEFVNLNARGRGGTCQALGRLDDAIEAYRVALAYRPRDEEVRVALTFCYCATHRYAEAEALWRESVASAPDAFRLAWLGYVYMRQQRWPDARDTLARALLQAAAPSEAKTISIAEVGRLYQEAFLRAGPPGQRRTNEVTSSPGRSSR